jgi:hypothetical protein
MSINPARLASSRPDAALEQPFRPTVLYWPAVAVAAVVAVVFVAGCMAAAWLLARPGGEVHAGGPPTVVHAADFREPADSPQAVRPREEAPPYRPAPMPLLALDALPGESVGRHERASHKTALAEPGLARLADALAEERPAGTYGTQVEFLDDPAEAGQRALKERKLLFTLHISGNFEDAKFT